MAHRTPLLTLAVAGALLLGACASDDTVDTAGGTTTVPAVPTSAAPGTTGGPSDPPTSVDCVDMAPYEWFGASFAEAQGRATSEGKAWRLGRNGDEVFPLTDDLVPGRVTFEIDDGTVTFAILEWDTKVTYEGAQDPVDVVYMGLSQEEAEARAVADGVPVRVVRVGYEDLAVTTDFSEERRNLALTDDGPCGIVEAVTRG